MKFLFDEMLKRLVHWCRIFGIYSEYIVGKSDSELLDYAKKNGLIFVTRDVKLFERCKEIKCVFIESDELEEQIVQILKETKVKMTFPDETRCPTCNGKLKVIGKERVEAVPEDIYKNNKRIWQCSECGKVYWEGGHWKNITRIYENVKKKVI
ncbi:Mut7-C RNAse domain-containing protein [Candidatus Micrarchaeota archaeon]|nr:Mut7-C RNAse domain-containing protein [Candidatus Micrarchaeota archaeon]